jgi:hypothetical protein
VKSTLQISKAIDNGTVRLVFLIRGGISRQALLRWMRIYRRQQVRAPDFRECGPGPPVNSRWRRRDTRSTISRWTKKTASPTRASSSMWSRKGRKNGLAWDKACAHDAFRGGQLTLEKTFPANGLESGIYRLKVHVRDQIAATGSRTRDHIHD